MDYEDPDGFYFLQWFWECTQTDLLDWNYRPPQAFKVLVFYPETGEYRASGIYERYAFGQLLHGGPVPAGGNCWRKRAMTSWEKSSPWRCGRLSRS